MSTSIVGLDPEFAKKLVRFEATLAKQGIKVVLTWGYRSIEVQNQPYAKGRTAPGSTVTNAYGGYSWHNYGLAADYAFIIDGKVTWKGPWEVFGKIARLCGLEWGRVWKTLVDRPHVQWTKGKTLSQMRAAAAKAHK